VVRRRSDEKRAGSQLVNGWWAAVKAYPWFAIVALALLALLCWLIFAVSHP
jgi:hypothetical protein